MENLRVMAKKINRNSPCPCGSGKKFKKCCMKNQSNMPNFSSSKNHSSLPSYVWQEEDGFHFALPGTPLSPEQLEKMTLEYQKNIRNSPMWDQMVRKFGKEKAEELLKQCRAKSG